MEKKEKKVEDDPKKEAARTDGENKSKETEELNELTDGQRLEDKVPQVVKKDNKDEDILLEIAVRVCQFACVCVCGVYRRLICTLCARCPPPFLHARDIHAFYPRERCLPPFSTRACIAFENARDQEPPEPPPKTTIEAKDMPPAKAMPQLNPRAANMQSGQTARGAAEQQKEDTPREKEAQQEATQKATWSKPRRQPVIEKERIEAVAEQAAEHEKKKARMEADRKRHDFFRITHLRWRVRVCLCLNVCVCLCVEVCVCVFVSLRVLCVGRRKICFLG